MKLKRRCNLETWLTHNGVVSYPNAECDKICDEMKSNESMIGQRFLPRDLRLKRDGGINPDIRSLMCLIDSV